MGIGAAAAWRRGPSDGGLFGTAFIGLRHSLDISSENWTVGNVIGADAVFTFGREGLGSNGGGVLSVGLRPLFRAASYGRTTSILGVVLPEMGAEWRGPSRVANFYAQWSLLPLAIMLNEHLSVEWETVRVGFGTANSALPAYFRLSTAFSLQARF